MQHRLYGLRGQAYIREYKRLYIELEAEIRQAFQEMYDRHQKFTPLNLGEMANKFRIPVKVASEYLEGYGLLATGTWERLQAKGYKAKDIGVVWSGDTFEENQETKQ